MLFPQFPNFGDQTQFKQYVLPSNLASRALQANFESFEPGSERRLQSVYTAETWSKLSSLKLGKFDWSKADVLDICAGKGFVSYHLLQKASVRSLTLVDLSQHDLDCAQKLLSASFPDYSPNFVVADFLSGVGIDQKFDVVIGNSFLHHFVDVPHALRRIRQLLKPNGVFVTLHEPTPAGPAVERGSMLLACYALARGYAYVDRLRPRTSTDFQLSSGDVWLFHPQHLRTLLLEAGFTSVTTSHWHLVRSLMASAAGLHLTEERPVLSPIKATALRVSIAADDTLRRIMPKTMFGSVAAAATLT